MSSEKPPARRESLTAAKKREKREQAATNDGQAPPPPQAGGGEGQGQGRRKMTLAELRVSKEKEQSTKEQKPPQPETQENGDENDDRNDGPSNRNSPPGEQQPQGRDDDRRKEEERLTLAELRARRERAMAQNLQTTLGQDTVESRAEPMTLAELRARAQNDAALARPGARSNAMNNSQMGRDKGQPLTIAKQRAKRKKAISQAIQESLAPIETEDEIMERLKKFNVNIDESARLYRKSIQDIYLKQSITDITLHVDQKVFSAHGLVLTAASTFFDKKIRVENCSYIRISNPRLPGHVFKHILEFFYSGSLHRDVIVDQMTEGLAYLKVTPSFQKMYGLALACELPLMEYFSTWLALSQAEMHSAVKVIVKHAQREFPKLIPDQKFFQLGSQQMVDLLSSDDLNTENEETVCDMALHWLGHNAWKEDDANAIFRSLRLHRVSTSYLESYVEDYPLLKHFPVCQKIVEEVRYFHDQPGRRHDFYDKRLHFRSVSPLTEAMVVFGGLKVDGSPSNMMLAFNFNTHAWCSLGTAPFDFGQDFAYCTYDNDIYVSGGNANSKQMLRFVAAKVRWTKCKSMQIARTGHCMQVVDYNIYVLGGLDEARAVVSEIEEYAVLTGTWRAGNQLVFAVNNACSAVIKDKIYIFGGKMDHKSPQTSSIVQCFDPRKGSVSVINNMDISLQQARSIKINKLTYVINQDGRIYEISDEHLTVTEIGSVQDFVRKKFGLYVHHGKILILGGHFKDKVFGELVCFQPNIHEALVCPWEDMMPPVRSDFGVVKIVLEKEHLKEELLNVDDT